jgi:hypothetical protein
MLSAGFTEVVNISCTHPANAIKLSEGGYPTRIIQMISLRYAMIIPKTSENDKFVVSDMIRRQHLESANR